MIRIVIFFVLFCAFASSAEARKSYVVAHDRCNIDWPCEGVISSPRGERIVKAMGGFGSAQKVYAPRLAKADNVVPHPAGCPSRAFCGCGAAVRIFGVPIRSLWLAANWFKFPRSAPAPGTVAVRQHHVFVLEAHIGGDTWQVYDANSGGHRTRIHARSIAGYTIVNPRGSA